MTNSRAARRNRAASGATRRTIATTDFYGYASHDFRPAAISSPQVNLIALADGDGLPRYDIADAVRPNYNPDATPDYTAWKATAGPFEFDTGNGLVPNYPTVTITANTSLFGAEIRIYDNDNSPAGSFGTELLGTESHGSATYIISTLNAGNEIWIQIMLAGYEEFLLKFTMPSADTALPITLKAEQNA